MPRYVKRRQRLSTKIRAERANRFRIRKPHFIDPYPWVHGTLPEKMVYAELSRRAIPFLFLNDIRFQIKEISFDKTYQADFVLPNQKIIIEVNGAYWHSMEKTIEADAFKYAVYQMKGYTVLAWWDYDILERLQQLFAENPALGGKAPSNERGSSELPVKSRKKPDTSGGIRTMNRRRGMRLRYKRAAVRQRIKR
jgi:very-short-patch-repair endonuclease